MINYHITVSGRVQGVGFRWSTMHVARQLNLTGFVQNKVDGTVYIEVQGDHKRVREFVNQVRSGISPYAKVANMEIKPGNIIEYPNFSIKENW